MDTKKTKSPFINREFELHEFKHLLANNNTKNTAILLIAPSGRGKSAFSDKLGRILEDKTTVRVDFPADKMAEDSGTMLIVKIASKLNEIAHEEGSKLLKLETFSKENFLGAENYPAISRLIQVVGDSVIPLAGTVSVGVVELLKNRKKSQINTENLYPREQFICYQYCIKNFETQKFLLVVSNIQYCDIKTIDFIRQIGKIKNVSVILEYTTYTLNKDNIESHKPNFILSNLEDSYNNVIKYPLRPLDWSHIRKILDSKGQNVDGIAMRFYENKNYNIREIIDYSKLALLRTIPNNSFQEGSIEISATTELLCELRFEAQLVAACISVHYSSVEIDVLLAMLHIKYPAIHQEINSILDILLKFDIITEKYNGTSKVVEISHDNLSEKIRKDIKLSKALILSCKGWQGHYEKILLDGDFYDIDKISVISRLIDFSILSGLKDNLIYLIQELKKYVNSGSFPNRIVSNLISLSTNRTNNSNKLERYFQGEILRIIFRTGLIRETREIANTLLKKSPTENLIEAIILHREGSYMKSDELCNELLINVIVSDNPQYSCAKIAIKLLQAVNARGKHEIKKGKRIYNSLLKDNSLKNVKEYGLILRQAAIFLGYQESLEHAQNSIIWFKKTTDKIELANSKLTYAMQLTRLGKLDQALKELDEADILLPKTSSDKEVIWNNRAVISIFKNEPSNEVKYFLKQASMLTRDRYRYIVASSNLYVYESIFEKKYESNTKSNLLKYLSKTKIEDKYLPTLCYYNFMFFEEKQGNFDKAMMYRKKISDLKIHKTDLWKAFLDPKNNKNPDMNYMLNNKWMLGFFPIYHFNFPDIDKAFKG